MLLRSFLACIAMALSLASFTAVGSEADKDAIKQLIKDFEQARGKGKEAMSQLYTDDAVYFPRSGLEVSGNAAIVERMFARPAAAAPSQSPPPPAGRTTKIITDAVDAGDKFGYAYGRVCNQDPDGKSTCGTRWLVVVKKGDDGKWRMQADIDNARKELESAK